ncbi:MAG: alkaline phosphatase [Elusimicrobia bacterium]|nr:alkaline phosphatase [Elusimicrobiota bacterium]
MQKTIKAFVAIIILACSSLSAEPVKNLILIIGDGMGPQAIGLLLNYARYAPSAKIRETNIEKLMQNGNLGIQITAPYGYLVTDSASAATQLATGKPSRPGMIGVDYNGYPAENMVEKAHKAGKSAGLVSGARLTYATPASFSAHALGRGSENEIAESMLASGADVMLGGGLTHWMPADVSNPESENAEFFSGILPSYLQANSSRKDNLNLIKKAQDAGYSLAFTKDQLKKSSGKKLLGFFDLSSMPDGIMVHANRNNPSWQAPELKDMAQKAIEILSQNKKGFFLMLEGELIDYASHHNDAGRLLHEMLIFDETLGYVLDWAKNRKDTAVVVTADHETGGFSFYYARQNMPSPVKLESGDEYQPSNNYVYPDILDRLYDQKKSFEIIAAEFFALPDEQRTPEKLAQMFNESVPFYKMSVEQASEIYDKKMAPQYFAPLMAKCIDSGRLISWTATTHSATPLLIMYSGPQKYARQFEGVKHSTEINKAMLNLLGLK